MKKNSVRKLLKKATAIGLAASMCLLSACGSSDSGSSSSTAAAAGEAATEAATTAAVTNEGTVQEAVDETRKTTASGETLDKIVVATPDDLTNWDPVQQIDSSGFPMRKISYQCLFFVYGDDLYPIMCKDYTEVDDYHWDVEIWDNIYDTDGNNITADDVVYSYDVKIASGTAAKYDAFESVEKVDDYTVRFTWTDALYSIGSLELILGETYIFSQNAFESHNFATDPVTTGPYYVAEVTSGSKSILKRNENYWKLADQDECDLMWYDMATVDEIEYDVITEASQNYMGLQTGSLDLTFTVPDENLADFMEGGSLSDNFNVYRKNGTTSYVLTCNQSEGSLGADENFRLAVYYALNNDAIASAGGNFTGAIYFANPACTDWVDDWYDVDSYVNTYDPELAKEYLDKSSYNGETITLLCESREATKNMMQMVQAMLLEIGINSVIDTGDYTTEVSKSIEPDGWDVILFYYGGSANISGMNRILNNEEWGTGCSFAFVDDETMNELFATASSYEGHTDENMTALTSYIIDNALYDLVVYNVSNVVYSDKFAQLEFDPAGTIMLNACEYYLD